MAQGCRESSIPKEQFPKLSNKLMRQIEGKQI